MWRRFWRHIEDWRGFRRRARSWYCFDMIVAARAKELSVSDEWVNNRGTFSVEVQAVEVLSLKIECVVSW